MRIAVIGAGGVGGYFGGRLAQAGADVTLVARGAHRAAIAAEGLRLVSPQGDAVVPLAVVDDPAAIGPVDVAIVAVKLWDTAAALARIGPLLGPDTAVMSLQNGVGKDDALRVAVGAEHVVGGLCYVAAVIERPGVIRQTGSMQRIVVAEYGGRESARLEPFVAACRAAGIDAALAPDIERALWEKFVFLTGLSGATCAIRQPVGVIRAEPRARALLEALFRETVAVGRARGVNLDPDYAADRLAFCDALPPATTSSMHGDLERGNRLELPWLQGALAELGRAANVPTPATDFVLDVLAVYAGGTPVPA
jgi:2-dehydropantoate 2-reductase